MSDSVRPHGLQPTRPLSPWDSSGKRTGVGAVAFSVGVRDKPRQQRGDVHTATCETAASGNLPLPRGAQSQRSATAGRHGREGTGVHLWLMRVVVQQKPTQYCKEIIPQFKKNNSREKKRSGAPCISPRSRALWNFHLHFCFKDCVSKVHSLVKVK